MSLRNLNCVVALQRSLPKPTLSPWFGHPLGRLLHLLGRPLHLLGRPLHLLGRPLHLLGRPLHLLGRPLHLLGRLIQRLGRLIQRLGLLLGHPPRQGFSTAILLEHGDTCCALNEGLQLASHSRCAHSFLPSMGDQ